MTAWRRPTPAEIAHDRRLLGAFLEPAVADELANMPVIDFAEQAAAFALRADAWLWRSERLLTRHREASEVAA